LAQGRQSVCFHIVSDSMAERKKVLVIGGGFSGLLCARDLHKHFNVTVVDAKEFFEYTPGILRAYVKPGHFDALTFTVQSVLERKLHVKFLWGEVKTLDGENMTAQVKPMFATGGSLETLSFDYCLICSGCNFNPMAPKGESLWFPTVHEVGREVSEWPHLDERFIEGRRRHIIEEHYKLKGLNDQAATILVAGAGFIGVEWATELAHFFPRLKLHIIDFLPNCLGPLPKRAADYCSKAMDRMGIKQKYGVKYNPKEPQYWTGLGMEKEPDLTYVCMGVKASNYFMPPEVLSDKGPGGGGWIHVNHFLQVTDKKKNVWGHGRIFAVGDCNQTFMDEIKPIPKISYPGEEQALHAVKSIQRAEKKYPCCPAGMCFAKWKSTSPMKTWWPWGAGMFATSLGPDDACFVLGATPEKGSGYMVLWGLLSVIQKEIIESSKVDECKGGFLGEWIWHYVHHTCCHCPLGQGVSSHCCPMLSCKDDGKMCGFC